VSFPARASQAPTPTSGAARPAVAPSTGAPLTAHEITILDGRFMHAACTCGWRSAGRRSRATARTEARDHALLYADPLS
jgi:hypothetical protein